jgi:hypothetical protein
MEQRVAKWMPQLGVYQFPAIQRPIKKLSEWLYPNPVGEQM